MTDTKIKPAIYMSETEARILRKAAFPENRNPDRETVQFYDEAALEAAVGEVME